MDCLGTVRSGRVYHRRNTQIAFRRRRRPDANRLVRHCNVQRIPICGRIHRDGRHPHFLAGADDPAGDFAPVGDQNFVEHAPILYQNRDHCARHAGRHDTGQNRFQTELNDFPAPVGRHRPHAADHDAKTAKMGEATQGISHNET